MSMSNEETVETMQDNVEEGAMPGPDAAAENEGDSDSASAGECAESRDSSEEGRECASGEREEEREADAPAAESEPLGDDEVEGAVEALLFASGDALSRAQLQSLTGHEREAVEKAIESLKARLNSDESGVELVVVADKYQLRTKPRFAEYVRRLKAERPKRLSAPALETLSIVAYRQPIVKSDIEKIRGVDVTPTLKTLLDRKLIKIVGHRPSVGQPALYGTTEEFLKLFGMRSLGELPTLRDLNELERDPGESTGEERDEDQEAPAAESAEEAARAVQ